VPFTHTPLETPSDAFTNLTLSRGSIAFQISDHREKVSRPTAEKLVDTFIAFGRSLKLDAATLDKAHVLMMKWVDLHIP